MKFGAAMLVVTFLAFSAFAGARVVMPQLPEAATPDAEVSTNIALNVDATRLQTLTFSVGLMRARQPSSLSPLAQTATMTVICRWTRPLLSLTATRGIAPISARGMSILRRRTCLSSGSASSILQGISLRSFGDGRAIADGLGDGALAGKAGALGAGAKFRLDAAKFAAVFGQAVLPYLPDGIAVTQSGTKWTLPKAGKVAYKNGAVDEMKLGDNPSGLKLTYKAKDGSFKGSFKAYAVDGGKATTVNVTGVMVNGVGYGTATIKGRGVAPVTIE